MPLLDEVLLCCTDGVEDGLEYLLTNSWAVVLVLAPKRMTPRRRGVQFGSGEPHVGQPGSYAGQSVACRPPVM